MTTYTIQEAAEITGMSAHTLRYYERIGLIQPIGRVSSGHRRYAQEDLGWIEFLKKLRATGMPIQEMKQYADLMWQGDSTSSARRQLLERHQARMLAQLRDLNDCLSCIEWKIAHYKEFESLEKDREAENAAR
jgi:DNA-binding transcriptional MerR regulator